MHRLILSRGEFQSIISLILMMKFVLCIENFDVFYNDQPIRLIGCMAEGCIDKGKETLVKKMSN